MRNKCQILAAVCPRLESFELRYELKWNEMRGAVKSKFGAHQTRALWRRIAFCIPIVPRTIKTLVLRMGLRRPAASQLIGVVEKEAAQVEEALIAHFGLQSLPAVVLVPVPERGLPVFSSSEREAMERLLPRLVQAKVLQYKPLEF